MLLAALVPASLTARSAAHLVLAASRRCLLVRQRFRSSLTSSRQRLALAGHLKQAGQSKINLIAPSAMPSAIATSEAAQLRHGVVTAAAPPADDVKSDR
jgi:hypothetical protein